MVRELGLEDATDTLGRWLAHRLAELLDRSRSEKSQEKREEAQKSVEGMIVRLWAHRSHWPQGWPPGDTVNLLAALNAQPTGRREPRSARSPWLVALDSLTEVHRRERELWVDLAMADLSLAKEKRMLKHLPPGKERETIEKVLQYQTVAASHLLGLIGGNELPDDPKERGTKAVKVVEEIERERKLLLEGVLANVGSRAKARSTRSRSPRRGSGRGVR